MSRGASPVVLDATVLTNFASTDAVDWLFGIVGDARTSAAVETELRRGLAAGYDFLGVAIEAIASGEVTVAQVDVSDVSLPSSAVESLDSGERAALALAKRDAGRLGTDDAAARRVAREWDVPVTGSIGLLAYGVEQGRLTLATADSWLDHWVEHHQYYAPVDSVADVLTDE